MKRIFDIFCISHHLIYFSFPFTAQSEVRRVSTRHVMTGSRLFLKTRARSAIHWLTSNLRTQSWSLCLTGSWSCWYSRRNCKSWSCLVASGSCGSGLCSNTTDRTQYWTTRQHWLRWTVKLPLHTLSTSLLYYLQTNGSHFNLHIQIDVLKKGASFVYFFVVWLLIKT